MVGQWYLYNHLAQTVVFKDRKILILSGRNTILSYQNWKCGKSVSSLEIQHEVSQERLKWKQLHVLYTGEQVKSKSIVC